MLTKSDLKQIRTAIKEEVSIQISPMRTELKSVIKTELKPIKEDISQIRKDIKTMVSFFDREYLDLRKRVEKIEERLKIQSSN